MKHYLTIAALSALSLLAISCSLNGYSEFNGTDVANFNYDASLYTDSLIIKSAAVYGASGSYIALLSSRKATGEEMTGGFGLTIKRDSSLVISEDNAYPQYTLFATDNSGCAVFLQSPDPDEMPEHDLWFYAVDNGTCSPSSCSINNTQQTVYNILSDDSEVKFASGDYLKLTITGILDGSETGSIDYYLADWRGDGSKPDSVLTSWKTISLSKLSEIEYVDFSLESSRADIPWTFCLDNFISAVYLKY